MWPRPTSRARWAGWWSRSTDDADIDAVLDEVRDTVAAVAADLTCVGPGVGAPGRALRRPGQPVGDSGAAHRRGDGSRRGTVPQSPAGSPGCPPHRRPPGPRPRSSTINRGWCQSWSRDWAGSAPTSRSARATAAANGLTQAFGTPLLDLAQRSLQLSEATAHRRVWRDREPAAGLARSGRKLRWSRSSPRRRPKSHAPRHNWAAAAAGEASHVVVGGAIDAAIDTAKGSMNGPGGELCRIRRRTAR